MTKIRFSFASYSPQYRKQYHSRQIYYGSDESNSSVNDSGKITPDFRNLNVSILHRVIVKVIMTQLFTGQSVKNKNAIDTC